MVAHAAATFRHRGPALGQPLAFLGAAACSGGGPCEQWAQPVEAGYLANAEIAEASGLVASRFHAETLYTHNDGDGDGTLYAVSTGGSDFGVIQLRDEDGERVEPVDLEDIAAGPGPDGSPWLYLADIGDNQQIRTGITVYAFPEPEQLGDQSITVQALSLRYPDSAHDAETLLFDPADNSLVILTKASDGETRIFSASAHPEDAQQLSLEGTLSVGTGDLDGDPELTGGDIAADGGTVLLRTVSTVFAWERASGEALADTLAGSACAAPTPAEAQGESVAFFGEDFYTVGEGVGATLWLVEGT